MVQNRSWVALNAPTARARARAVAPGRAPGFDGQHLEVVVQTPALRAFDDTPGMAGHDLGPVEHLDGVRAEADLDTPPDIAGGDRVEDLADRHPAFAVDPGPQRKRTSGTARPAAVARSLASIAKCAATDSRRAVDVAGGVFGRRIGQTVR